MLKHLNLVMPYWESPDMLREQVRHWLDWRTVPRQRTTFLIVDDCSAEKPIDVATLRDLPLDIRVFRIARKVVWNWRAAKNIAMHEAPGGWSLITDIDHVLPRDEAAALFKTPLNPDCAYHVNRRTASDGSPYKPHSST